MPIEQITLTSVWKIFKQDNKNSAILHNVTATFQRGKSYAIMGVSGSGKSTLLHMLAGIEQATSGIISIDNTSYDDLTEQQLTNLRNRHFGLVFQDSYLIPELTMLENVIIKGLINGLSKKACIEKGYELLKQVGLAHKAHAFAHELSGGEQQRIAIARVLFYTPDFIIADEPTGHLDKTSAMALVDFLVHCQRKFNIGLIISTHDIAVAQKMETIYRISANNLVIDTFTIRNTIQEHAC